MTIIRTKLQFRSEAEGGRKFIPKGPVYSTVARFGGTDDLLSMVFRFHETLQDGAIVADAELLVPSANSRYLVPGNSFELLEGRRIVAVGMFISAEDGAKLEADDQHELACRHRQLAEIIKDWGYSEHDDAPDFDINAFPPMTFSWEAAA